MESRLVRFLGSIQLAIPLLAAIAAILIGATFYESKVGSETVQREIYKSLWFGALMLGLSLNLGLSTLTRYPWRGARKTGFALTHMGLILLIAGSAAVIHLNTEGMLRLRTDSGPSDRVRVAGDWLEVVAPDRTREQTDIFVKPDGSIYPKQLAGLSLLGYSENAIKTVAFTDGGGVDNLAVKLRLSSDRMGQTLERWIAEAPTAYRQVEIGPARLELVRAQSDRELKTLLSPPDRDRGQFGQLQIQTNEGSISLDLQQYLGRSTQLPNGIEIEVLNVWPDFRLDANNQPTSASDRFRNPAVQLVLREGHLQERWFVFSNPGFAPIRSSDAIALDMTYDAPATTSDSFRVVVSPTHQLFYAARSSKGFISGELEPGRSIAPGWADFQISLAETIDRARIQRSIIPVTPVAPGAIGDRGTPALHVATADGIDRWLLWGEPTTLDTDEGSYFAAFSPKLLQLPFTVRLEDFIVERNEGSESVAMWTSQIALSDPHTGQSVRRKVWMNHPTWFKGWKLAQASWNPGDLQQSTLQVKREPGWVTATTWAGSLLVVVGIGTLFYGSAIVKRIRKSSRSISQPIPDVAEDDRAQDTATSEVASQLAITGK